MIVARTTTFKKEFKKLPREIQEKTLKSLRLLVDHVHYPSLNVHKMEGAHNVWEARMSQGYRFTFHIDHDAYVLRHVGTHDILKKELP